ncbi:MAG: site-specific integrase [Rhizobiaceae bacterium]
MRKIESNSNVDFAEAETAERPYVIHQRKGTSNLWMRFTVPGHGQQRIGLKTSDWAEAEAKAEREYQRAMLKAEEGILEGKTSFDRLARLYVAQQFKESDAKPNRLEHARYAKRICERYLTAYFGRKPITSIREPQLYDYIEWRRTYWTEGPGRDDQYVVYERNGRQLRRPAVHKEPSLNTLKREANVIRGLFKFAVRKGFLNTADIPRLELGRTVKSKRPAFTKEEFNKLIVVSQQRMLEAARDPKLRYQRMLLHQFMIIAAETGMRTKELFNLNWGHLEGFKDNLNSPIGDKHALYILAYGKGKEPQRLVPTDDAFTALEHLWNVQIQQWHCEPSDDQPVFAAYDQHRLGSLKKVLNGLLEAADLKFDRMGRKFSAYSFRHSYATWQLQRDPPMDIYTLATNMRTSVKMIEDYYSDVVPADRERALRGRE